MFASVGLAGINLLLALGLVTVYVRNHRELRSPFTLGLFLFASFFVLHNALVFWHSATMMGSFAAEANLLLVECLLETGALGSLLYATLR